jgi:dTDP-6-deoxy-L-talose 4-dehydrogenase (NAD+)
VTGGGGYVGRHVVDVLLARQDEVLLVAPKGAGVDPRATHLAEDFRDTLPALDGVLPDSCIHLAWRDGFRHFADSHMSNLSSHFDFLTSLADAGMTSLTVLGSMHEVGYWEGPVDADTPTEPKSLYGVAKNALRQALTARFQNKPIDFRWIRAFYIMGDDATNQSIFARILGWEAEGKPTFPFTSGLNKYDFIEVSELARQIVAADSQNALLGIINCCTGEPETLRSRVERFIQENGLKIVPEYGAFPERPYDSPGIWGDASNIRTILQNQNL